jgi:DNA modification methylase
LLDLNKVYIEDCLNGIKKIEDNTIHLIVTSPPYYNAKEYSHWQTYEEYLTWLKKVFQEGYRVLKNGRMCCVNISVIIEPRTNRNTESKRIALPFHFVNLMEEIGFKFIEDIVWVKPEGSAKNRNGRFSLDRQPVQYKPNIVNEYIFVFQKPMKGLIDKIVRGYSGETKELSLIEDGYDRTNIWYMNPKTKSNHPAPYPEELSDKCIKYYSYVSDIVLDPFMGSGTTSKSANKSKRNWIGFEIHQEYVISNKEISNDD